MKKPNIETLVKRLKRLNSKHEKLQAAEKKLTEPMAWGVSPERRKALDALNSNALIITRLENQILNALLAQLP